MVSYVQSDDRAQFCLPQKYTAPFLAALRDGTLNTAALAAKTSAERRAVFAEHLGPENAKEVNALFESKLLLKNQRDGMIKWAQQLAGNKPISKSIEDQIQSLDKVLNPADQRMFLKDLADKKLGVDVTAAEAKQLLDAAKEASDLKTQVINSTNDRPGSPERIAWGRAQNKLTDMVDEMKPDPTGFWHWTNQILGIPKSALTSVFHMSAPLVQAWGMLGTKQWYQGFGKMFQYLASEENYQDLRAYIVSHPRYNLAVDGKLGLTNIGDKLSQREEAIQSSLLQQANTWLSDQTHLPNLIKASSRSFTGYLNFVRFERFQDLVTAADMNGEDIRPGSQTLKDLASVVNNFTGRADLGRFEPAVGPLNSVFFALRKFVASFNMFSPTGGYLSSSPTARMAAVRQITGSILATFALTTLASQAGYKVDMNPVSQNFMKIQMPGGLKLDVTGGNAVYTRLLARILTNQMITSKGVSESLGTQGKGGFTTPSRADLTIQYIRGKLSPVASMLADAMYGKDPIGNEFNVPMEVRNKLAPIPMQAFFHMADNYPADAVSILPAMSVVFGAGLEAPLPPLTRSGLTPFGEGVSGWSDPKRTDLDDQLQSVGYSPSFPPKTINGIKLTDDQYHDYIKQAGVMSKMLLTNYLNTPGTQNLKNVNKLQDIKNLVNGARSAVQSKIILQSRGTQNDIMEQMKQKEVDKVLGNDKPQ